MNRPLTKYLSHGRPVNISKGPREFFFPAAWPKHFEDCPALQQRYERHLNEIIEPLETAVHYGLWFADTHKTLNERCLSPWQLMTCLLKPEEWEPTSRFVLTSPAVAVFRMAREASRCGIEVAHLEDLRLRRRQERGKSPNEVHELRAAHRQSVRNHPEYDRAVRLRDQAEKRLQEALEEIRLTIPEQYAHCLVEAGRSPSEYHPTEGADHAEQDPPRLQH